MEVYFGAIAFTTTQEKAILKTIKDGAAAFSELCARFSTRTNRFLQPPTLVIEPFDGLERSEPETPERSYMPKLLHMSPSP